jgi:hypothetical protein
MMAVALGGLGLVVAAHGSDQGNKDAVTVESSAGAASDGQGSVVADGDSGGSTWGGLPTTLQHVVNDQSIRLLDFGEIDQVGSACSGGPVRLPQVISVVGGESALLDEEHVVQLQVDGDVLYGDVDGDGLDEAVVHTVCAYGANGAIDNLQVWDLETGTAVPKATAGEPPASLTGPFPPAVKGMAVTDGTLEVTWSHYAEDDPNCCAALETTLQYEVDGDELAVVGDPRTSSVG